MRARQRATHDVVTARREGRGLEQPYQPSLCANRTTLIRNVYAHGGDRSTYGLIMQRERAGFELTQAAALALTVEPTLHSKASAPRDRLYDARITLTAN